MTEDPTPHAPEGPLAGVRVLDLSRALAGPYASLMLADAGADVIKVERPGVGDNTRSWGPPFVEHDEGRESIYFLSVNRGKRSIELDLQSERGRAILTALAERSDVLIENFRPGVMARLGIGPALLMERNRRLVVLSISGFGPTGPESDRPGFDQIVQGEAGLMSFTGPSGGPPTKVGVPIADLLAGIFGAFGVVAALHERERSGRGQQVHSSLLSAIVGVHVFQGARWLIAGEVPEPLGNRHPLIAPYGAFQCADGMINIAIGTSGQWRTLCELLSLDPADSRFVDNDRRVRNMDLLQGCIEDALADGSAEEWIQRLTQAGVPAGRVRTVDQVYAWNQVSHLGLIDTLDHPQLGEVRLPGPAVTFARSGRRPAQAPPVLGADTGEILREVGWED